MRLHGGKYSSTYYYDISTDSNNGSSTIAAAMYVLHVSAQTRARWRREVAVFPSVRTDKSRQATHSEGENKGGMVESRSTEERLENRGGAVRNIFNKLLVMAFPAELPQRVGRIDSHLEWQPSKNRPSHYCFDQDLRLKQPQQQLVPLPYPYAVPTHGASGFGRGMWG